MLKTLMLAPVFLIQNPGNFPLNEEKFSSVLNQALTYFEQEVSPLTQQVTISISGPDCLRTGYNRRSREVVFCPNRNVLNAGLDSVDVINHELFHAFLCQHKPALCESGEFDYLHEALADTFSYQLDPDKFFGENFYHAHAYIRSYHSSWRPGLVKTEHEKGTALAAKFIKEKKPLSVLVNEFNAMKPSEEVRIYVAGRETSHLNRYRLKPLEILNISFKFSDDAGVMRMKWITPDGILIQENSNFQFSIRITPDLRHSKAIALFLSEKNVELGRQTFYLGSQIDPSLD